MNPQVGQPQNPYMQHLSSLQGAGGQQAPGQNQPGIMAMLQKMQNPAGATPPSQPGGAPVAQGAGQASGLPGVQQPDVADQDASFPGSNPGITKNLLGASQQLHQAIAQLTDPDEIRVVRTILMLLTNLIQRDQMLQNGNTGKFNPQSSPQQGGGAGPGLTGPNPAM